jgi:transcriptional regulator with PAS, ATPase and Fis domain
VGATATRSVDVRIVAATNRDLRDMVAKRTFREDLWYRLGAFALRVPPLRERADDVAPLAHAFLVDASRQYRRRWLRIADEALGMLRAYTWPGNVRELRSVMNRAALLHDDEVLRPGHLPPEIGAAVLALPTTSAGTEGGEQLAGIPTLEAVELGHIRRVLDLCGGNRTLAAQHLDITRQTLARKIGGGEA